VFKSTWGEREGGGSTAPWDPVGNWGLQVGPRALWGWSGPLPPPPPKTNFFGHSCREPGSSGGIGRVHIRMYQELQESPSGPEGYGE
jgi:hypothetical protein